MVIESTAPTVAIERIALKFRLEIFDIAVFSCARSGRGSIHFSNMPPDKTVAAVVFMALYRSSAARRPWFNGRARNLVE
jgi:hypothetical protein